MCNGGGLTRNKNTSLKRLFTSPINIRFILHSFRRFGEPKIKKPKELRGIKRIFSIDYIPKKCKCQVFIKNNDVWIKHRDYFSEGYTPTIEELGMPLNYFAEKFMDKNRPKKFIYDDAWGAVIFRNEAWLKIENLVHEIKSGKFELDIVNEIREQQERIHELNKYELCCSDMERFWEKVIRELLLLFEEG